jgi:zeaxanthin glucosyltransferase
MKLGFISPNAPGHLNPMTALARQLQARRHDVIFLYSSDAAGLPCDPGDQMDPYSEQMSEVSKKQGEDALQVVVRILLDRTEHMLKSLPTIVKANGIDALVIDTVQFYAELGAMQLGMPFVHVSSALYFDYSGHTPLCLYGWPHQTGPTALARNREGAKKFIKLLNEENAGIKAIAEVAGLHIDWDDPSSTISPLASITQVPKEFDFDNSQWPLQFYHTGPFHDGDGREKVEFPWEQLTGEPLVYASMGTILNGRVDVFRTIVTALSKHKDLQLVLSIGDQIHPAELAPLPKNSIIVPRAPQLELLKRSVACITHGGLNTVLESLAQGVPQVAIPVAFDQPGVAARISEKQTGVVTSLEGLSADRLSMVLDELLNVPTYRHNAQKVQTAITNGERSRRGSRFD